MLFFLQHQLKDQEWKDEYGNELSDLSDFTVSYKQHIDDRRHAVKPGGVENWRPVSLGAMKCAKCCKPYANSRWVFPIPDHTDPAYYTPCTYMLARWLCWRCEYISGMRLAGAYDALMLEKHHRSDAWNSGGNRFLKRVLRFTVEEGAHKIPHVHLSVP